MEFLDEDIEGRSESQPLARSAVESVFDLSQLLVGDLSEIEAARQRRAGQAVGVLVAAAFAASAPTPAKAAEQDVTKWVTGFMQAVDAISLVLVQAAKGHGHLYLAMKWLRSGRLGRFTTLSVAIES